MTFKSGLIVGLISGVSGMILGYIVSTKDKAAEEERDLEDRIRDLERKIALLASRYPEQPGRTNSREG